MRPIRTLIVDDEPAARRGLEILLEDREGFEIAGLCADGSEMIAAIRGLRPDLVLLDVQMPGMDGFTALSEVATGALPHVVFVTAYDRYAVRAFEAHAIDFLLKPVSEARFDEACDRVRTRIRAEREREYSTRLVELLRRFASSVDEEELPRGPSALRFAVRSHRGVSFVRARDLVWVAAAGDYVRLHTKDGSYLLRQTMGAMESRLDRDRFIRVHRSTIVRTDAIEKIRAGQNGRWRVLLADGTERPVSRGGKKRLEEGLGIRL